jgi:hypothetical protein
MSIRADQQKVPHVFTDMKATLTNSLGTKMETEIDKIVDNLNTMFSSFEEHF